MDLPSSLAGSAILFVLVVLGNVFLYGLLAWKLRRAAIGVLALMLVGAWIVLPPSDKTLTKRFTKHRNELERLVQMANSDAQFSRIGPRLVETVDGKEYRTSDAQSVLPQARWDEYRRLLAATGMSDGLQKDTATGDVFLSARTLGRIAPIVVNFGYVYCSAAKGQTPRSEPCRDNRESQDRGGFYWKRLNSEWSIYKQFGGYPIE